mmetsp:Transcript_29391/g.61078  ORF Transcript_29391/g.61078 Transcript_29391/m.61078 type:complete len:411 (-) Transcript_29391:61-1293(-)
MTKIRRRMCPLVATTLFAIMGAESTHAFHFPTAVSTARTVSVFKPVVSKGHCISSVSSSALGMATWSNGQAIREYQDFLASGKNELDMKDDGPSVIVQSADPSKVTPLTDAVISLGNGDDLIVTPGGTLPQSLNGKTSYPIFITLPPYELKEFLQNLSEEWKTRAEDFVFFSGGKVCGVVEPTLREFGLCRDAMTQVVVGFSLPKPGSGLGGVAKKPEDLACMIGNDSQGDEKWAGESVACGKWNGAVAGRLNANGIRCKTVFYREWRRAMWERALYDAVWNVVGAVRDEQTDHADVAMFFELEASDMMWELANGLRGGLAVTLIYGFEDRLFSIAETRGKDEQCELIDEMFDYMLNVFPGQCRMLWEYCNYAKDERGLLQSVNVPSVPSQLGELPSPMRQGNLRADGNI